MKVATILPQPYLTTKLAQDDYHMCLGHLVNTYQFEAYTQFYIEMANKEGNYVMMDNGVIENEQMPFSLLYKKAKFIGAHEIILPDIFQDATATINSIDMSLDILKAIEEHISASEEEPYKPNLMAVPQGRTISEWIGCALLLCERPEITTIGIPKVLGSYARDGRLEAIAKVAEINWFNKKDIHLLGCWVTPLEVTTLAKAADQGDIPDIRGIDSAIAYYFTREGLKVNEADRPGQRAIDFSDSGYLKNEVLLDYNIEFFRECVNTEATDITRI